MPYIDEETLAEVAAYEAEIEAAEAAETEEAA